MKKGIAFHIIVISGKHFINIKKARDIEIHLQLLINKCIFPFSETYLVKMF